MVVDRSFLRPVLLRYYVLPLFKLVPARLSPNSITAMGLVACLVMIGLVQFLTAPTAVLAAICSLLVNVYILADHFDGLQAKKYDRASRFGEFLDHFCDFFSGACVIAAAYTFTTMSSDWLTWVSVAYVLAFSASHFEHNASGTLFFALFGPLEALVIACLFFFAEWLRPDYWTDNHLGGIRYQYLFATFILLGFIWCTWSTFFRIRLSLRVCHFEFAAGAICLGACSLLLPQAWLQFWIVLILFGAANVASVLTGERLQPPRLACRELPWLAGLVAVAAYCSNYPSSIYMPASSVLAAYAAVRSGIYMHRTVSRFHLEAAEQR